MIPQTFGERLRVAMREANVRNSDVATAGGVHVKTVSKWLSDVSTPEAAAVFALAQRLQVRPEWLLRGEGAKRDGAHWPRATVAGYTPRPDLEPRLPPAVYAIVHEKLSLLDRASVPGVMIEEAERLMVDAAFNKLNVRDPRERTLGDMIADVRAIWAFIHQALARDGYRLGHAGVYTTRLSGD